MPCYPPPFASAVLAEALRIAPRRRVSSDGICADAAHYQTGGDHVPDSRGIPHAVDISQSKPGAPFWDPRFDVFDAHAYGWEIGKRMLAGTEKRVKYLVSFDGSKDVILNLDVSREWRQNGAFKQEHASHLHVSYTVGAEQSVAPFFSLAHPPEEDDLPLNAADIEAIRQIVRQEMEDCIGGGSLSPPDPHATVAEVIKRYVK